MVHKTADVLDALPKSVHGRDKKAIHEITEAENKAEAKKTIKEFGEEFGVKWPKANEKIVCDEEALLAYYDFPAEHWRHLRTTNPIESPFATVRARTDITKGPGSREAGDDLQADGGSRREVAEAKRLPAGAFGEGRGQVRQRRVGGKERGEERRVIR
jgi:hypothetical protein